VTRSAPRPLNLGDDHRLRDGDDGGGIAKVAALMRIQPAEGSA
jgi:hypothetical protein